MTPKHPVIGLLGGIASGKSTVAQMFASLGAAVIDADRTGHEVLELAPIQRKVRQRWGAEVLDPHGRVDRKKLAARVFADKKETAHLVDMVHPSILRRMKQEKARIQREGRAKAVILDAALLLEAGLVEWCDVLVFVDAERRLREERVRQQRQWNPGELAKRARLQIAPTHKKRLADFVIDNNGSRRAALAQVRKCFQSLTVYR